MLDLKIFSNIDFNSKINNNFKAIQNYYNLLFNNTDSDVLNGWVKIENSISEDEIEKIKETSSRIRKDFDALLVIGIGGSFLGSKAIIDAVGEDDFPIYFAGNNLSSDYIYKIKKELNRWTICWEKYRNHRPYSSVITYLSG